MKLPFGIARRQRSHCSLEYHNYAPEYTTDTTRYINLVIGHPRHHAWWAFSMYVYLPNRKHRIVVPGFRKVVKLV